MRNARCPVRTRKRLTYAAGVVALSGWGWAAWLLSTMGHVAGVDGVFVFSLSLGIAFTAVWAISVTMPDQARIFALGVERGLAMQPVAVPGRRLSAVR